MTDTTIPSMREENMGDMSRKCEHGDFHAYCYKCTPQPDLLNEKDEYIAELEAKIAELQKDADRYRWLANNSDGNYQDDFIIRLNRELFSSRREFDEAIDAAIAEEGV